MAAGSDISLTNLDGKCITDIDDIPENIRKLIFDIF